MNDAIVGLRNLLMGGGILGTQDLGKHRNSLMGFAIIIVFMVHAFYKSPFIQGFAQYGWMGVDIFFFLSAVGQCNSLRKNNDTLPFYKRKLCRVLPTWWGMLLFFHLLNICLGLPHPNTFAQVITYYSGFGYWLKPFLHVDCRADYYEWYIPTLLLFYLVTPIFYRAKKLVLAILISMASLSALLFDHYAVMSGLHLAYARVPIYICGILYFKIFLNDETNTTQRGKAITIVSICGVIVMIVLWRYIPWLMLQCLFLPVAMPVILFLLCRLIESFKLSRLLSFYGMISLEMYLIHLYWNMPEVDWHGLHISYDVMTVAKFVVCTIGAYMVHQFFDKFDLIKKNALRV